MQTGNSTACLLLSTGIAAFALACAGAASGGSSNPFPLYVPNAITPSTDTACAAPRWCLEGVVVDRATSRVIEGAEMLIEGTECMTITNEAGRYRLSCDSKGEVTIRLARSGYDMLRYRIRPTAGAVHETKFSLSAPPRRVDF